MYIPGINLTSKKELISKKKKTYAKTFSSYVDAEEGDFVSKATDISIAPSLSNVLALQDLESPIIKEKELFDHAHKIIDELELYRRQMLLGGDTTEIISALKQKASKIRSTANSKELEEIIEQAELRVAIEAAKKGDI